MCMSIPVRMRIKGNGAADIFAEEATKRDSNMSAYSETKIKTTIKPKMRVKW